MVVFSFIGGAAVYRANVHIAVRALVDAVDERSRRACRAFVNACMLAMTLFMVFYGASLVQTTWGQSIAEFPGLSVGITYLPIPIAGFITLLFLIERLWLGDPPADSVMFTDQPAELE